jgi:predicted metal-dependent peptidase
MIKELKKTMIKKREAYLYDFLEYSKPEITKKIPTMAVNKNNKLFINENFAKKLSEDELIGCLYHEALHIIFKHTLAEGNPSLINLSGDIYINELLQSTGIILPECAIFKKTFNVPKNVNTCQEIYDWLEKNLEQKTKQKIQKEYDKEQELNGDENEKVKENVGDVAKELYEEIIEKYKEKFCKSNENVLKWDIDLTLNIGKLIKRVEQKNYLRPSRTEVKGLLLPRCEKETLIPLIHLYVDVSGSMQNTLPIVIDSLLNIKNRLKEYKAKYYSFNTVINEVKEDDLVNLFASGGTEFKGVIDGADLHIIITDGELDFSFINSRKDILVYLCDGEKIVKR